MQFPSNSDTKSGPSEVIETALKPLGSTHEIDESALLGFFGQYLVLKNVLLKGINSIQGRKRSFFQGAF